MTITTMSSQFMYAKKARLQNETGCYNVSVVGKAEQLF